MDNLSYISDMLDICRNNYHYLMAFPNVQGVGVGFKSINGKETNIPSIHVLVDKKINISNLTQRYSIPSKYMKFHTDIIETGIHRIHGLNDRIRPLQGGYSVSAANSNVAGSLGCIVTKGNVLKKEYFILNSNHIIAGENQFKIGTDIVQPSHIHGGVAPTDSIARLFKFIPIKFKTAISTPSNYMDCAIARLNDKSLASKMLNSIGKIKGVADPILKSTIRKIGAGTGLTQGTIATFGVTLDVKYEDNKSARFLNQFRTNLKTDDGDSGAVIVDKNNKIVGLLLGGGDDSSVFTAIKPILNALEVSIFT